MHKAKLTLVVLTLLLLAACGGGADPVPEEEASNEAPPTAVPATETSAPSPEPSDTPEPTATEEPAEAIAISEETGPDSCPLVELNPAAWQPLYTAYKTGGDPFFHIHTNEAAGTFYFNLELYTVYGPSWTGQLGSFTPDCNANGLCVYLVPDAVNPYWVTAGEMEIVALSQVDGVFAPPLEINFNGLTLEPVPGSSSTGCYHIESLTVQIEE